MTTKLNLSISSYDEQDPSASTHNTNISSSDPDELISALRKLSGIKHQEPAAKSCGCEEPCDCEMEVVDEADQEPANAPEPRTLADLRDVIDAAGGTGGHTARGPTDPVPSRSGDNPLADKAPELDENEINTLAESLARDWMSDKLQHIAENFNPNVAAKAYSKGKTAYRHKLHEFAIREDGDLVKVFPVLEGRVMTQVPLYVMEVKLRHLLPALAVGGALGGISHMLDTRSYDNNPNIVQLKAELARTTDPTMQKEIKAAIEREKAFQDAEGRPRVAPTNESVDCMECGMGRYTPMEEGMTCDECGHMMDEGNAFSGELARARAHHEKSFDVDGHHYNVTESKKKKKKAKNPYAVGMAAAKKAAGYSSKPAKDLPKKVITKAHEIGKEIKKKK